MKKYLLTNKAVRDLSDIWNYTFNNWSEFQADKCSMSKCGEGLHTYFLPHNSEGADRLEIGLAHPMNLRMLSVQYVELEKKRDGRFPRHSNPQSRPFDVSELGREEGIYVRYPM